MNLVERSKVLLVDDDPTVITVLGRLLEGFVRLRFATGGEEALRLAAEWQPDLVLLDVQMPDLSGFEVCARMKRDPLLTDVPVIFVTAHDDTEQELLGLELGAVDFIGKPPRGPLVLARVRTHLRVKQMADALRVAAATDGLTGLANRRRFDEVAPREWLRAQRSGAPLSLLLVDIDHFKAYNDHYGHPAGDRCLQAVAQAMRSVVHRPADLLARFGGEEFVLLLPETDARGAAAVAQQLIQAVDGLAQAHAASPVAPTVSVSVGLSCQPEAAPMTLHDGGSATLERLLAASDQALYAAKKAGRHGACLLALADEGHAERAQRVGAGAALLPPQQQRACPEPRRA
ncbi:diguanylate cyclase [Ideonella sp. DXS22W]|uniref:diguanylate cyclase n=1 Tax=Pseudaquabacterium inlustre TaxID=2984192 RepID=A0ABU9CFB9_9BURK